MQPPASEWTATTAAADASARDLSLAPQARPVAPPRGLAARAFVRGLDIAVSATVLLLASPLLAVIAVLIRLDSPGPVLFRHVRVGQNRRRRGESPPGSEKRREDRFGRPFTLYKFRTMYADARERFPELYAYTYESHELHTIPIKVLVGTKQAGAGEGGGLLDDPRITGIGRWLRRTSLDELPNFISVLLGDMHLVGPRPDIVENVRYYDERHLAKLDVRPGLTGLAQVQGRGNLSFHETNEWDVRYVEQRSVWLDLKILARTVWVSLRGEGAF